MKRIAREVADMRTNPPEGIILIDNEENFMDIQAWIQGPGTPFESGCFRVKLILGNSFPQSPPKGLFLTKIFHPNVSDVGEICVSTLKKDWKSELGIKHILLTIKCLLIVPNAESALNEEAGRLLLEDYAEFSKHARLITKIHGQNSNVKFPVEASGAHDSSSEKGVECTAVNDEPATVSENLNPQGAMAEAGKNLSCSEDKTGSILAQKRSAGASPERERGGDTTSSTARASRITTDKRRTLRRL
ncbi:hypothetical protein BASA61_005563 [Batrachochytrium salamandrivorans]|nr:hypothetical protein BASA61_005563 [Batrachochytrium salamandrivorans]